MAPILSRARKLKRLSKQEGLANPSSQFLSDLQRVFQHDLKIIQEQGSLNIYPNERATLLGSGSEWLKDLV